MTDQQNNFFTSNWVNWFTTLCGIWIVKRNSSADIGVFKMAALKLTFKWNLPKFDILKQTSRLINLATKNYFVLKSYDIFCYRYKVSDIGKEIHQGTFFFSKWQLKKCLLRQKFFKCWHFWVHYLTNEERFTFEIK